MNDSYLRKKFVILVLRMLIADWLPEYKSIEEQVLGQHARFVSAQIQKMSWPYRLAVTLFTIVFLSTVLIFYAQSFLKVNFKNQKYVWEWWRNSRISIFRDFIALHEGLIALTVFSPELVVENERT